jgi:hypothetical protein
VDRLRYHRILMRVWRRIAFRLDLDKCRRDLLETVDLKLLKN